MLFSSSTYFLYCGLRFLPFHPWEGKPVILLKCSDRFGGKQTTVVFVFRFASKRVETLVQSLLKAAIGAITPISVSEKKMQGLFTRHLGHRAQMLPAVGRMRVAAFRHSSSSTSEPKKYSSGLAAASSWNDGAGTNAAKTVSQQQQQAAHAAQAAAAAAASSAITDTGASSSNTVAAPPTSSWLAGAEWASIGTEFKGVDSSKFLSRTPSGFLTERATTDVQPAEELLSSYVEVITETYKGVDVRDPSTVSLYDGEKPSWLTMGDKVRAVSEFISGHIAHHVSLPEWQNVFDLKHMEMDVMYWLWVLHLHMVARRATSTKIDIWSRRREVLEELMLTMFASWSHTSEEVMGRPPLSKIRNYIKDMYYVTAVNLEEALMHDGPGGDLMLLGVLLKFCPLPRPEDIPMYTYYTLVHYVRFHIALLDRLSDEEVSKGNFNFLPPTDPAIFKPYSEVELDQVIRGWAAEGHEEEFARGPTEEGQPAAADTSAAPEAESRPRA
jgi:hypothetical protein